MLLYILCTQSRFVSFFFSKIFHIAFASSWRTFLCPLLSKDYLCGFNFTLIFGKHSLYKERKISGNILYASLTFRKILASFQSILRNFYLNLSIDLPETLRLKMYCSVISASILFFLAKMIGKWSEISVFTIAVLISMLSMIVFVNT